MSIYGHHSTCRMRLAWSGEMGGRGDGSGYSSAGFQT